MISILLVSACDASPTRVVYRDRYIPMPMNGNPNGHGGITSRDAAWIIALER